MASVATSTFLAARVSLDPGIGRQAGQPSRKLAQGEAVAVDSAGAEARRLLASLPGLQESASAGDLSALLVSWRTALAENAKRLAKLEKMGRDPGKRIADIQQKLKQLLLRMQRAALMGDKRAAAAIAREAAALAKDLAAAVKEAASDAKQTGQGPGLLAGLEVTMDPVVQGPQSASQEAPASEGGVAPANDDLAVSRQAAAAAGLATAMEGKGTLDPGLVETVNEALQLTRTILSMARATIERNKGNRNSRRENSAAVEGFRKEMASAQKEFDEAAASIQADTSPAAAAVVARVRFTAEV